MRKDYLTLLDRDGNLLVKAIRSKNRLYKVTMEVDNTRCLQVERDDDSAVWHARLGHVNRDTMRSMMNKEVVTGIPNLSIENETCASCLRGKQTRKSFPKATAYRASHVLELIQGDLCGPISPTTAGKKRYVFVLIDDHTRYMWSILLEEKSEAFEKFKIFKRLVEQETGSIIGTFRTDRGGEFTSQDFQAFCDQHGIKRHLTAPYSPQQNGVVERRNRTLMEMTRSMMKHMSVPSYLWGEAVRHSTYLIHRVATRTLRLQTPYECYKKKKPNVGHLRVFGCVCYAKNEAPHLKKLDDRSRELVHLGIEPGSKAYRLYDPTNRRVVVSRDVIFAESKQWKWNEKETDKPTMITLPMASSESTSDTVAEEDESEHAYSNDEETEETEETEDQVILRRSTRQTSRPSYLDDYVLMSEIEEIERVLLLIDEEPWDWNEAKDQKVWRNACEEEITSIKKNKTWTLVDLPEGSKAIGL